MYNSKIMEQSKVVYVLRPVCPYLQDTGVETAFIQHLYLNYLLNTYYVPNAVLSAD